MFVSLGTLEGIRGLALKESRKSRRSGTFVLVVGDTRYWLYKKEKRALLRPLLGWMLVLPGVGFF